MSYFKINNIDFSMYVNSLAVAESAVYNSQTNAAGDTVIDLVNSKLQLEVGIIPLDAAAMASLQAIIGTFGVNVTFRNPKTNELKSINCVIPSNSVEYYTIQDNKTMYKAFKIKCNEL